MAKVVTAGELRGLSRSELDTKVTELKEELFTLRFQAATASSVAWPVRAYAGRGSTRLTERESASS